MPGSSEPDRVGGLVAFFDGFALDRIGVGDVVLRVRRGGVGPPVVLLHGHPRTHTTWHRVAPLLARHYTVVCPDLRGYGQSSKPPTDGSHEAYSKRAMAADIVRMMASLGYERFGLVGHDRGSYVALRAALDHPSSISALAFLGVVPIGEAVAHCGVRFATAWWHWFFFNVPDVPERVINANPDAWYLREGQQDRMGRENYEDFVAAIRDRATVRAMLEDYRAGLNVDRYHDQADLQAGKKVSCPTLVMLATKEGDEELYPDVREIWRSWTTDLRVEHINTGHHMAEEAPAQLAELLRTFLTDAI